MYMIYTLFLMNKTLFSIFFLTVNMVSDNSPHFAPSVINKYGSSDHKFGDSVGI